MTAVQANLEVAAPQSAHQSAHQSAQQGAHDGAHGYSYRKDDYRKRLRRIEGQVKGIARMVESDAYCIDILTQVSAVNKALEAVALGLLEEHMNHCVVEAARLGGREGDVKLREAADAIARLVRS